MTIYDGLAITEVERAMDEQFGRIGGLTYHAMGEGVFRCVSPRRKLRYGGDVRNEVQYQAWGDAERVDRLELHVKIHGLENVQPTLKSMVDMGETLSQQAVSLSLPQAIRDGILGSTPVQARSCDVKFSVLRRTAGLGGQDIILRIE